MTITQANTDPHFQSIGQASAGVVVKLARNQSDPWAYWSKALAIGNGRQLTRDQMRDMAATTEPQLGFYRMRNKDGKDRAIAIGLIGKVLTAWVDGDTSRKNGEPIRPEDIWTYCCSWPISHEQYEVIVERGEHWPDDGPARDHNLPDDPHEAAKVEFEDLREQAAEVRRNPVRSQEDADRRSVLAKKIAAIYNDVDKLFRAKKAPILKEGKVIDDEFRWRLEAQTLSQDLKADETDFLQEQQRLENERQAKAKAEAARLQREAEEKARKATEEAKRASPEEQERLKCEADEAAARAAAKEREAQAQKVYAGRTGAKTSLRTYRDAQITDYPRLVDALRDREEVQDLIKRLADASARERVELPGMKIRETQRAA